MFIPQEDLTDTGVVVHWSAVLPAEVGSAHPTVLSQCFFLCLKLIKCVVIVHWYVFSAHNYEVYIKTEYNPGQYN